jgi:hypothetical protein
MTPAHRQVGSECPSDPAWQRCLMGTETLTSPVQRRRWPWHALVTRRGHLTLPQQHEPRNIHDAPLAAGGHDQLAATLFPSSSAERYATANVPRTATARPPTVERRPSTLHGRQPATTK